jgi:carbon storage regulator
MLILSRKINESIILGDNIVVSVVDIKGDQVKIGISAPKEVKVYRKEVFEAIQNENKAAVIKAVDMPDLGQILSSAGTADNQEKK